MSRPTMRLLLSSPSGTSEPAAEQAPERDPPLAAAAVRLKVLNWDRGLSHTVPLVTARTVRERLLPGELAVGPQVGKDPRHYLESAPQRALPGRRPDHLREQRLVVRREIARVPDHMSAHPAVGHSSSACRI